MKIQEAYIVIDIGTGNARVAVVRPDGVVVGVAREDIRYITDDRYPNSIYFDPEELWAQILRMTGAALQQSPGFSIMAITATSQREGIVLIDQQGASLIGLPNIDHRGREWENIIPDKSRVYRLTGRYPSSLFSALKLVGIRERRQDIWERASFFLSISDWVEYMLSGIAAYEHSQASETLLYDVERKCWSPELAAIFHIEDRYLPVLADSGTAIGNVLKKRAAELSIPEDVIVVKGGGDTQLAIRSTCSSVGDIVIVSGTTTPVVKLVDNYITDIKERTWTSRDIENGRFVFEANAGVTGLNYQRLKEVFYPNESYAVIEKELADNKNNFCMASLGSLIASEKGPLTRGGFVFPAPVTHQLTRSCFVRGTLIDIAFSIAENYRVLCEAVPHEQSYIWACGGGLQSPALRQYIADIIGKEVRVRAGFHQSSATGGALLCNEALRREASLSQEVETVLPRHQESLDLLYKEWKETRNWFRQV